MKLYLLLTTSAIKLNGAYTNRREIKDSHMKATAAA
jgi:hypothetical protein